MTLRIPLPLYDQIHQLAKKQRVSINRLATKSLEKLAAEEMNQNLREAFDALGRNEEESDVTAFASAQQEVLEHERD